LHADPEASKSEIRTNFKNLDTDKSGRLSHQEFHDGLAKMMQEGGEGDFLETTWGIWMKHSV
jgi:hypothetical protein